MYYGHNSQKILQIFFQSMAFFFVFLMMSSVKQMFLLSNLLGFAFWVCCCCCYCFLYQDILATTNV